MSDPMSDFRRPGTYDATRPLVLGYLRAALCRSERDLAQTRDQFAAFAHMEGYTMGTVFTEHARTAPAAFSALIEAVKHYDAKAIVVPTPAHLAVLGAPPPLTDYVQNVTGVPLLMAQPQTPAPRRPPVPRHPP